MNTAIVSSTYKLFTHPVIHLQTAHTPYLTRPVRMEGLSLVLTDPICYFGMHLYWHTPRVCAWGCLSRISSVSLFHSRGVRMRGGGLSLVLTHPICYFGMHLY